MTGKNLLRYIVFILIIIFSATFTLVSCKTTTEQGSQQVSREHTEEISQSPGGDISDLNVRAYQFAQSAVQNSYPDADIISAYSPGKVIEEAPGVFQVEVESSDGSLWYCVCQYIEAGDRFEVIELVQAGRGEAGSEGEYVAEEDQDAESQGSSSQEQEEPQDGTPPEEQPQDSMPEPQDVQPEEQIPEGQTPTEQEIEERVFRFAQYNTTLSFTNVVPIRNYEDELVEKISENLYVCIISFKADQTAYGMGGLLGAHLWYYLVRYNVNESEMQIPFKTDVWMLCERAYLASQGYILNEDIYINNNCQEMVFESSEFKPEYYVTAEMDKGLFKLINEINFTCHGEDGNTTSMSWDITAYYDITKDGFTKFISPSGGSI